ncbi:MAG TPA: tetratricopeptide repeat protein [Longimicrobium sp.]|nr:tetratricopeptide repeat protein [Longimicrobium sp.]
MERFHRAIEALGNAPEKAAAEFRALLAIHPDDIDTLHHLALAVKYCGNDDEAIHHWTRAVGVGLSALPDSFYFGCDRLEWGSLPNRPFLRAYYGAALGLLEQGLPGEAATALWNLLDLNPRDNQGARLLLVRTYFGLRRPGDVLRVCERFETVDPELLFGRALALIQLGRLRDAEAAYAEAAEACPHVHDELLKTRHPRPAEMHPGYVTAGGADEAFSYWEAFGKHWKGTRGALAMARRHGNTGRALRAI